MSTLGDESRVWYSLIAGIQKVRRIDEISAFWGIMNGTTNYIVYSMLKDGTDLLVLEQGSGAATSETRQRY